MKTKTTATLLLTAMLACSCSWHIGDRIRESRELRTGVDITRPVGGQVYCVKEDGGFRYYDRYYILAPEVTYKKSSPIVTAGADWFYGYPANSTHVQDTGVYRWVKLEDIGTSWELDDDTYEYLLNGGGYKRGEGKIVESLPKGARRHCIVHPKPGFVNPICTKTEKLGGRTAASVLAAPFDYVVDPALSVVSDVVHLTLMGIDAAVCAPFNQRSAPPTSSQP